MDMFDLIKMLPNIHETNLCMAHYHITIYSSWIQVRKGKFNLNFQQRN